MLNLIGKRLINEDMTIVVKKIIIDKQCTKL